MGSYQGSSALQLPVDVGATESRDVVPLADDDGVTVPHAVTKLRRDDVAVVERQRAVDVEPAVGVFLPFVAEVHEARVGLHQEVQSAL